MNNRYLIYRKDNGLCVNTIVWDGESDFGLEAEFGIELLPENCFAGIGWTRIKKDEWIAPVITQTLDDAETL